MLYRQHRPLFFDLARSQLTLGIQSHMQQLSNCSNSELLFIVDSCIFLIILSLISEMLKSAKRAWVHQLSCPSPLC